MENMPNISNIFNTMIEKDEELDEIGTQSEKYLLEHPLNDDTTENKEDNAKKKDNTKKNEEDTNGIVNIKWKFKTYTIARFKKALINHTKCVGVTFINNIKGFSEKEEVDIEIDESWPGLLGVLLGVIHEKYGKDYTSIVASYGIFDNNIKIRMEKPTYLDETADNIVVYKVKNLDIYIEYNKDKEEYLFNSIKKAVKAIGIKENDIKITLLNPKAASIDGGNNEKLEKKTIRKSRKTTNKTLDVSQEELLELLEVNEVKCNTLKELYENNDLIINGFNIESISIDNEKESFTNNIGAIGFILSYLVIFYENKAIQAIINNTAIDEIGVTNEKDYRMGIFEKINIVNTELYFYTNGLKTKQIEYLYKVFNEIGVEPSSLTIGYTI